jgi:hypothetical protein
VQCNAKSGCNAAWQASAKCKFQLKKRLKTTFGRFQDQLFRHSTFFLLFGLAASIVARLTIRPISPACQARAASAPSYIRRAAAIARRPASLRVLFGIGNCIGADVPDGLRISKRHSQRSFIVQQLSRVRRQSAAAIFAFAPSHG